MSGLGVSEGFLIDVAPARGAGAAAAEAAPVQV